MPKQGNEQKLMCTECPYFFYDKAAFDAHKFVFHGEQLEAYTTDANC